MMIELTAGFTYRIEHGNQTFDARYERTYYDWSGQVKHLFRTGWYIDPSQGQNDSVLHLTPGEFKASYYN